MTAPSFDIAGRIALVTGGYGVLGGRLATDLARAGARVAILGRSREKADALVSQLNSEGLHAMTLVADALDPAALTAARDELESAWGTPDILVNAAGGNVAR